MTAISKRLVSENAEIGQKQYWHDHDDGSVTIETVQKVDNVAEANKEVYNQVDAKANWKGDMHRVASIPMAIFYDLQRKGILNDPAAMKKWLNNPDNRVFRTRPGQV
tara:strand:- start:664 stop:984 length:321 start_codon:yes stop_codon:yes gene_type:complete